MVQTLRKDIAEALAREPMDLRDISQRFGIKEKDVIEHLQHIAKSTRGKRLKMEPAYCRECDFSFKKRDRLNTPSRCPRCKSESIVPPRFQIVT